MNTQKNKGFRPNPNPNNKNGHAPPRKTPHELEIEEIRAQHKDEILALETLLSEQKDATQTAGDLLQGAFAAKEAAEAQYAELKGSIAHIERQAVKDRGEVLRLSNQVKELQLKLDGSRLEEERAQAKKVAAVEVANRLRDELKAAQADLKALGRSAMETLEDREEGIQVDTLSKEDIEKLRKRLSRRVKEIGNG